MTIQKNVTEARAKLSELIARAEAGEEVVIERRGKPIVTLRPIAEKPRTGERRLGAWAHLGKLRDPYLFLRPDPELEEAADRPIFPSKRRD